jgi:hypothetical protein
MCLATPASFMRRWTRWNRLHKGPCEMVYFGFRLFNKRGTTDHCTLFQDILGRFSLFSFAHNTTPACV